MLGKVFQNLVLKWRNHYGIIHKIYWAGVFKEK